MVKRIALFQIIIISFFIIKTSYNNVNFQTILRNKNNDVVLNNFWTVTDGITIRLLQDHYPPNTSKMTLVLENNSDSVMMYGQGWSFEKYEDGVWRSLETINSYGFFMLGHTLNDHDRNTFPIWNGFLKEPLNEGLYRVAGRWPLKIAPDVNSLNNNENIIEYPPYKLEFIISKYAAEEPEINKK